MIVGSDSKQYHGQVPVQGLHWWRWWPVPVHGVLLELMHGTHTDAGVDQGRHLAATHRSQVYSNILARVVEKGQVPAIHAYVSNDRRTGTSTSCSTTIGDADRRRGSTALHVACRCGQAAVVRMLLELHYQSIQLRRVSFDLTPQSGSRGPAFFHPLHPTRPDAAGNTPVCNFSLFSFSFLFRLSCSLSFLFLLHLCISCFLQRVVGTPVCVCC